MKIYQKIKFNQVFVMFNISKVVIGYYDVKPGEVFSSSPKSRAYREKVNKHKPYDGPPIRIDLKVWNPKLKIVHNSTMEFDGKFTFTSETG